MESRHCVDDVRDILHSHWLQLSNNLEAELIVQELLERQVLTNDEVNEATAKKGRPDQARSVLTAMERKGMEEFHIFAEVLTSCQAPLSLIGKEMLETIGLGDCRRAETNSKVSADHVVEVREIACQTSPYPIAREIETDFRFDCILKLGLIIMPILLTVCLFTSVKWMQLQQSVLDLEEYNHSLTRNHSHLVIHLLKNYTNLKGAYRELLMELDKDFDEELYPEKDKLLVIQKEVYDIRTKEFSDDSVESERVVLNEDPDLKAIANNDQLVKENSDLRTQLHKAVKAQRKALSDQRQLYKDYGQLVKENSDFKTKLSEGVCDKRSEHSQETKTGRKLAKKRVQTKRQAALPKVDRPLEGRHVRLEENTGIFTSMVYLVFDYLCKALWEIAFISTSSKVLHLKLTQTSTFVTLCVNLYLYLYHPILFSLGGCLLVCIAVAEHVYEVQSNT